ncbi:MAG: hypothetical protein NT062_14480, partial [Proteobacteria bacterium]|nr:hypothetical protein [Pseudomonadota bacterium]
VRPGMLKAQAYIDLGKYADAIKAADEVLAEAADSLDAQVLRQEARLLAATKPDEKTEAMNALESLTHKLKNKRPSHALGFAHLMLGEMGPAKDAFLDALKDVSTEAPNPVMYRTETGLAQIALAANDIPEAAKHLDSALKLNAGYFPARALQAKVVLKNGEADRALLLLEPLVKEGGANAVDVQLTMAEALITRKGSTAADKDSAKAILVSVKDKAQPPTEVGRLLALIDPKLPEELGVPVPEAAPIDPKDPKAVKDAKDPKLAPKPPKPPKRRGR